MKSKEKIYSFATIVVMLDQLVKILVRTKIPLSEEIPVIPHFFSLYHLENKGAAFSILGSQTLLLILVSIVCIFILDRYLTKEKKQSHLAILSFGIIIGGIIGNLIDRILYQGVTDYLSFQILNYNFPVFNLADIGITVGAVLLIISFVLEEQKKKKHRFHKPQREDKLEINQKK